MPKYSGADWLQSQFKDKKLSPLARKVADILGQVYRGIYHLNRIDDQDWFSICGVRVFLDSVGELATYDGSELTTLVMLCHEQSIRLSISAGSIIYKTSEDEAEVVSRSSEHDCEAILGPDEYRHSCLYLEFHQRSNSGGINKRHPTLDEAVSSAKALAAAIGPEDAAK